MRIQLGYDQAKITQNFNQFLSLSFPLQYTLWLVPIVSSVEYCFIERYIYCQYWGNIARHWPFSQNQQTNHYKFVEANNIEQKTALSFLSIPSPKPRPPRPNPNP